MASRPRPARAAAAAAGTVLTLVAGLTTGAAVPASAEPTASATLTGTYTYTVLADSADGFDPSEFGCAALNNAGQVAFRGVDTDGVQGVYRADSSGLTTIARDKPSAYDFMGRNPSINNAGQVSFAATLQGPGEAIFRGDGTTLEPIATTVGSDLRFFGFDTSINESGRVAFKAELDNDDQGLFSAISTEKFKTYYLASDTDFAGDQSAPSIRGGRVAFFDRLDDDLTYGIFLARANGTIDTVIDTSSEFGGFDIPSLGRRGRVAVHAFDHDAVNDFIITARNGAPTTIADRSGDFGGFGFRTPSINTAGRVAYTASLGFSLETGVYIGKSGRPILEVGDALAGSTVANVVGCTEMLNDEGQVAFTANLVDGRTVVGRADPVARAPRS